MYVWVDGWTDGRTDGHCFGFYLFTCYHLLQHNVITLHWVLYVCLHVTIYFIVMQVSR
jgi:hypothetical protein